MLLIKCEMYIKIHPKLKTYGYIEIKYFLLFFDYLLWTFIDLDKLSLIVKFKLHSVLIIYAINILFISISFKSTMIIFLFFINFRTEYRKKVGVCQHN